MEKLLHNISKTTNATGFIKAILKSSCMVLLDTCNFTSLTRAMFLLKVVELNVKGLLTFNVL